MYEWEEFRNLLLAFLQNSALFIILAYLLGRTADRLDIRKGFRWHALATLIFTSGAIISMSMPFEPVPGVKLDQRNMILLFAGPFGGPWAAMISGVCTALARIYVGGIGAEAGAGAAVTSALLGMVFMVGLGRLRSWQSAVLGAILLGVVNYPWVLLFRQNNVGAELTENFAVPFLVLYMAGAPVLSAILMVHERRRESDRELAHARQQLEDVLEVSTDWFWENDADLRFTYLSNSFRNVFSHDPDFYLGKKRSEMSTEDQKEGALAFEAMMLRHEAFNDFRYPFHGEAGGVMYISISGKPIYDENGLFAGYRGSGRDVTSEVKAEAALRNALSQAEAGNQAKARFLSHMSHELRTPLNAIIGFADMMRRQIRGDLGNAEYRSDAANIHDAGHHLLSLINDLLDLSRLEAGKLVLDLDECQPADIVVDVVTMLQHSADEAGLEIAFHDNWKQSALLDERGFKQIVINLLSNAVKFTGSGGTVTIELSETVDRAFTLSVTDTGSGIPEDELENVLRPFERSRMEQLMATEGSGLGLPITNALAQAHGGALLLTSEVGRGTRAEVRIPHARSTKSEGAEQVA